MSSTSSTGPSGMDSREIASEPSTFRACCVLLAIDFCSARSSLFSSTWWKGRPRRPASRAAKSGTKSGCRRDGMQVTHCGAGGGDHSAIISRQAWTSSSANRPSSYLPCRTRPPQPASRQMQSALPTSARLPKRMFPWIPNRGRPPDGHRLRGSMGRLVRRRNWTASLTRPGAASSGRAGRLGGRITPGSPSSARMRNSMCPDLSPTYSRI